MIAAVVGALAAVGLVAVLHVLVGVSLALCVAARQEHSRRSTEKRLAEARAAERGRASAESARIEAEYRASKRIIPRKRPSSD
jgi:hypothetical protein